MAKLSPDSFEEKVYILSREIITKFFPKDAMAFGIVWENLWHFVKRLGEQEYTLKSYEEYINSVFLLGGIREDKPAGAIVTNIISLMACVLGELRSVKEDITELRIEETVKNYIKMLEVHFPKKKASQIIESIISYFKLDFLGIEARKPDLTSIEDKGGDTFEIGIDEDEEKPYVKINGKLENPPERVFALLALLAAQRRKNIRAGYWSKGNLKSLLGAGDQWLTDVRKFMKNLIEKAKPHEKVKGGEVIKGDRHKIRLEFFKPENITIDRSICSFESIHRNVVMRRMTRAYRIWKNREARGIKVDKSMMEEILAITRVSDIETFYKGEIGPLKKHILLVARATEIMGWKLHNQRWRDGWNEFMKECDEILDICEIVES